VCPGQTQGDVSVFIGKHVHSLEAVMIARHNKCYCAPGQRHGSHSCVVKAQNVLRMTPRELVTALASGGFEPVIAFGDRRRYKC